MALAESLQRFLVVTTVLAGVCVATAQDQLAEQLQPFAPFIGKTWRGEMNTSPDGKQTVDISRWERALNGQAIRILHSINNGEYGGESLMFWDREKESVVFYYFTTAGFYTTGTVSFEDGKFVSHEVVSGNDDGVTEVKSVGEILPDGRLRNSAQYLKNGEWVDGHSFIYVEDPDAQVIFK